MKTLLQLVVLVVIIAIVGGVAFFVMNQENVAPTPVSTTKTDTAILISQKCGLPLAVKTETINEEASTSPSVSVEYPQFPSLTPEFNQAIRSAVLNRLQEFRKEADENFKARKATAPKDQVINKNDFSFLANFESVQTNSSYVSLIIRFDSYIGGANENQDLQTFNLDVINGKILSIGDLFASSTDYLSAISTEARKRLLNKLVTTAGDAEPTEILINGTIPREENFRNFTFTETDLQIYFPKYAVAAGALGEQQVSIPFISIGPGLDKSCKTTN